MAKPTFLKVLGDRSVPEDMHGEPDMRAVDEAFPKIAPGDAGQSPLGQDILELLRKSHDRIEGQVNQATAIASEAINRVDAATAAVEQLRSDAVQTIGPLADRVKKAESETAHLGDTVVRALNDHGEQQRIATAARMAASSAMLTNVGEKISSAVTTAFARAPALLALGAAVWLWRDILSNPSWLQLGALGLFGACVIAPAVWLSARRN